MTLQQIIDAAEAAKTGGAANLGATPELVWELLQALAQNGGGGGGASAFTGLTDVPSAYTGAANKLVSVKGDESGLEFVNAAGGGGWGTTGTVATLTGDATLDQAGFVFTFTGNVGIGVTPSADQLFVVNDGVTNLIEIDKANFVSNIISSDGTAASGLITKGNLLGTFVFFELYADDGSGGLVDISGDAIAQTITITAANNVILGGYGSGTHSGTPTHGLAVDSSGNIIEVAGSFYEVSGTLTYDREVITSDKTLTVTTGTAKLLFIDPNPMVVKIGDIDGDLNITYLNIDATANLITYTAANHTFAGNVIFSNTARLKDYTVATLPAGTAGDIAYVTDALLPTFLATVAGSGAVVTPVFYDGSNWKSF